MMLKFNKRQILSFSLLGFLFSSTSVLSSNNTEEQRLNFTSRQGFYANRIPREEVYLIRRINSYNYVLSMTPNSMFPNSNFPSFMVDTTSPVCFPNRGFPSLMVDTRDSTFPNRNFHSLIDGISCYSCYIPQEGGFTEDEFHSYAKNLLEGKYDSKRFTKEFIDVFTKCSSKEEMNILIDITKKLCQRFFITESGYRQGIFRRFYKIPQQDREKFFNAVDSFGEILQ